MKDLFHKLEHMIAIGRAEQLYYSLVDDNFVVTTFEELMVMDEGSRFSFDYLIAVNYLIYLGPL